jgi:hypothetical protein
MTNWERRATVDRDQIHRWWTQHPEDNVAIATGPADLVVVDIDMATTADEPRPPECIHARNGLDVYNALAGEHGGHTRTWTVGTASGGWHLYYRTPASGGPWRNTTGRLGWHIDTRAAGGYVVAEGSAVHGHIYVAVDLTAPVELPGWIANLLAAPATRPRPPLQIPDAARRGYARAALDGEIQRVHDAPVGQRNAALNQAAWNLGRHIASGLLDRVTVEDALRVAGEAVGGQTPAGVAATIRSAIDARLRRGQAS